MRAPSSSRWNWKCLGQLKLHKKDARSGDRSSKKKYFYRKMKISALLSIALAAKGKLLYREIWKFIGNFRVMFSNREFWFLSVLLEQKWDKVEKRGGKHGRLHVDNPGQDRLLLHYPICMTNRESPLCDQSCVKERGFSSKMGFSKIRNVFLGSPGPHRDPTDAQYIEIFNEKLPFLTQIWLPFSDKWTSSQ